MTTADTPPPANVGRRKRSDARRNQQTLLDAAAAVFVRAGVDAPVRDIAAEAGVGMGTIYRHFPTRADLVVAVFRHQLDALTTPAAVGETPYEALRSWVARFADFLVTKHGLAEALHSDQAGFESLHAEFVDRLLPVLDQLLKASAAAGQTRADSHRGCWIARPGETPRNPMVTKAPTSQNRTRQPGTRRQRIR
jgi:AcrR family transcriptional regulator